MLYRGAKPDEGDGVVSSQEGGTGPSARRLSVVAAIAVVAVVIGFVADTWGLESPVSLPELPWWLSPLTLLVLLGRTWRRDRPAFRQIALTGTAVAVLFGAGLAMVAAATL